MDSPELTNLQSLVVCIPILGRVGWQGFLVICDVQKTDASSDPEPPIGGEPSPSSSSYS
jgi:hypothetical protein